MAVAFQFPQCLRASVVDVSFGCGSAALRPSALIAAKGFAVDEFEANMMGLDSFQNSSMIKQGHRLIDPGVAAFKWQKVLVWRR